MAQRFDTDGGTAFAAPLFLVDQDGNVLFEFSAAMLSAIEDLESLTTPTVTATYDHEEVNDALEELADAINAIIDALQEGA
jgi:hypothetical protein